MALAREKMSSACAAPAVLEKIRLHAKQIQQKAMVILKQEVIDPGALLNRQSTTTDEDSATSVSAVGFEREYDTTESATSGTEGSAVVIFAKISTSTLSAVAENASTASFHQQPRTDQADDDKEDDDDDDDDDNKYGDYGEYDEYDEGLYQLNATLVTNNDITHQPKDDAIQRDHGASGNPSSSDVEMSLIATGANATSLFLSRTNVDTVLPPPVLSCVESRCSNIEPALDRHLEDAAREIASIPMQLEQLVSCATGTLAESSILDGMERDMMCPVTDRNSELKYESLFVQEGWGLSVCGRVDGLVKDDVTGDLSIVEVKNRQKRLFCFVPRYEQVQAQVYMWIFGAKTCKFREHFHGETWSTTIQHDPVFLAEIQSGLVMFVQKHIIPNVPAVQEHTEQPPPKFNLGEWVRVCRREGHHYQVVSIQHTNPRRYGLRDVRGQKLADEFTATKLQKVANNNEKPSLSGASQQTQPHAMQKSPVKEEDKTYGKQNEETNTLAYLRMQLSMGKNVLCELYPGAEIAVVESGTEQAYFQYSHRRLVDWIEPARADHRLIVKVSSAVQEPRSIQHAVLASGYVIVALHFPHASPDAHPLDLLSQQTTLPTSIPLDAYSRIRILVTTCVSAATRKASLDAWRA